MSDHELLDLAAKAAGILLGVAQDGQFFYCERGQCGEGLYKIHGNSLEFWNPLTDDGDALRLAVKLGFAISIDQVELMTYASHDEAWKGCIEKWYCHPTSKDGSQDQYAATRRAIVRAAAEIGKAMP